MSTYAIGDVQGCFTSLERLVRRIRFDPARDRLWFTGDLVNRGPASLEVLRYVKGLGERAVVVLGNHDLHLLAMAEGIRRRRRHTLGDVLEAPDLPALLQWLRSRPLLHREGEWIMVHAGLLPAWTPDEAAERAAAAARDLMGAEGRELLRRLEGPLPEHLGDAEGESLWTLAALTRMRACTPGGQVCLHFTGRPDDAPEGCVPWFRVPGRRSAGTRVVFGHWAMLGWMDSGDAVCLDTGCVYGGSLTALRLEDGAVFREPCAGRSWTRGSG